MQKRLKRLVLVIINVGTKEVLERWQFDVEAEQADSELVTTNKICH